MRMEDIKDAIPVKQRVKYIPEKELWIVEHVTTSFLNKNFMAVVKENAEKEKKA